MRKLLKSGGQRAGPGVYWDFVNGECVELEHSDTLPGGETARYLRAPTWLVLLSAPILGLAFVLFLPFIGLAMSLGLLARHAIERMTMGLSRLTSFGWRPAEAYFNGTRVDEDEATGARDGGASSKDSQGPPSES